MQSSEPAMVAAGPIPEAVRERILLVAVGDHLERSQMMLIEVVNEGDGSLDLDSTRRRADALLTSNRLYRQSLSGSGEPVLESVLDDRERVLLDITHSEPDGALEGIRRRIEENGLLFKVRIIGSQVRKQDRPEKDETESSHI